MAMKVHVDVVSAEGHLYSGQGEMIYAPAVMGEIGIAPRHAPLVSRLKAGDLRVDPARAMAELGWRPRVTMGEECRRTVEAFFAARHSSW